ncbi:MAG: S49 family peptidase, partial [Geminicoccales bacterium]
DYSERGRARLEAFLDSVYAAFTDGVARGRDMPKDEVLKVAQGRVWTGAQAKERGLVDQLGGFAAALAAARETIGLEPDDPVELRRFPPPRSLWEHALQLLIGAPAWPLTLETVWQRLSPGVLSMPPIVIR